MVSDLFNGLQFGSDIEVYYTLENEEESKPWFPATVINLNYLHDDRREVLKGTIQYKAAFGFRACKSKVTFKEGNEFVQDGQKFSWRLKDTSVRLDNSASSDVASASMDADDMDYAPGSAMVEKCKKVNHTTTVSLDQNTIKDTRELNALSRRLQYLEEVVKGQQSSITTALWTQNPLLISDAGSNIPLKFISLRLEHWLLKTPTRPTPVEITRGTKWFVQDSFKARADCTLLQFDSISERVKAQLRTKVSILPEDYMCRKSVVKETSIYFRSFVDLSEALGPASPQVVRDVIIAKRLEKGTDNYVSARVIGCMAGPNTESLSDPCYMTIGDSLAVIRDDEDEQRHVVFRRDCTWDSIEQTYSYPLEDIRLSELNFQERISKVMSAEKVVSGPSDRKESFYLRWNLQSNPCQSIFADVNRSDVLGVLQVHVPFISIKGSAHVKQFINVAKVLGLFK